MPPDADVELPTGIATRQFQTARKGFDPGEVRAFLLELSEVVGRLQRSEAESRDRVGHALARAEKAEKLDQTRLVELLGEETARVLEAARTSAGDIRDKSQEAASRLISEANQQAHEIKAAGEDSISEQRAEMLAEVEALRSEAANELDRRRVEADAMVDDMRRHTEAECGEMRRKGEQARIDASADAEAIRSEAREEGRRMIEEAKVVREKMLSDLARRRRSSREQLERLNAARDRLMAAYEVVRRTVEEATNELRIALPEAKLAGHSAMRRVAEEPELSVGEMEAQVAAARMAGLLEPLEELESEFEPDERTVLAPEDAPTEGSLGASTDAFEPEPASESASESEGEPELESVPEPEPVPDPEPEVVPGPDVVPVPDPEPPAEPSPEPEVEPEPVGAAQAQSQPADDDIDELFARLRDYESDSADVLHTVESVETVDDAEPAEPLAATSPVAVLEELQADKPEVVEAEVEPEPEAEDQTDAESEFIGPLSDDDIVAQRDDGLGVVERSLGRHLKRALADEQNEVLDLLRRSKPTGVDDVLPGAAQHAASYGEAARDDLASAAALGARLVDGAPDGVCDALADELGQSLVEPLRQRIEQAFDDSSGDLDEVTESLRSLYRAWKNQRIGEAVRHYTAAAYAQGAYGAVPEGTPQRWIVDRNGDPCPDADDNALAGSVCKGDAFPTGDHCPPAHVGCRCLVLPDNT